MKLAEYLKPLSEEQRHALAKDAHTTYGQLRNVAFSGRPCGVRLAVDLERATGGAVRRWDSRPADWHRIWPELVGTKGAPTLQQEIPDAA